MRTEKVFGTVIEIEDPFMMDNSKRDLSILSDMKHTFWNLCKCFVGAASFSLPWAVQQTGVIPATIGFIFLAFITDYTMKWLAICGHYTPGLHFPTYPQVAYAAIGECLCVCVCACVCLCHTLFCMCVCVCLCKCHTFFFFSFFFFFWNWCFNLWCENQKKKGRNNRNVKVQLCKQTNVGAVLHVSVMHVACV